MESIGQNLRLSREGRGLSLEQVARDTNISRQYIVALENDKFEEFPAEPYLIGFLRNYSDYLGLPTEELVNRYRTLKIQEQPAPLTQLIRQPSPWPKRILMGALGAAALALVLIFLVPAALDFAQNFPKMIGGGTNRSNKEYVLSPDKQDLTERIMTGDTIVVNFGDKSSKIQVRNMGTDIELQTTAGTYKMKLGDELFLDLDGNTQQDTRLFVKDFTPSDPLHGAEITVEKLVKAVALKSDGTAVLGNENTPASDPGSAAASVTVKQSSVLLEDSQAKPFTVEAVLRGYALLRYLVDDNLREENYYHKGETVRIEASKKVRLWVSNAGALAAKVNGVDFEVGKSGEVVASSIEWVKDSSGKYQLTAKPLN